MIIESLDDLKVWLINELEPICDADPAALAKYVIALAKKDKAESELKALCEDQLDVFLGEETKPFVGNLFEALKNKTYLPPAAPPPDISEKDPPVTDGDGKGVKRKSFEENPNKSDGEKLLKTENKIDVAKAKTDDKENINNKVLDTSKSDANSKAQNILDVNGGIPSVPQDRTVDVRMRSVSQDRSMKSMSPAVRSSRHSHGNSSRRRSSRSPSGRRHSRRQPSRSSRKEKDTHESRTRDRRYKTSRREKERCRDYEEKGYCMLGETCRFDHGRDPVEVDDSNLPQMLSLAASTFPTSQPNPPHLPNPPIQVFPPGVLPPRPLVAPIGAPQIAPNAGLTTVRVQNTRPVASPVELPPGQMPPPQVPIFRPRNPIAFMRNLTPGVPSPIPSSGIIPPLAGIAQPTPVSAPGTSSGEPYNPEEPSIDNDVSTDASKKDSSSDEQQDKRNQQTDDEKVHGEENKTQDELVKIAMGGVPLTPILGPQQTPLFQPRGNAKDLEQNQIQGQHVMNFPDLLPQTYIPMGVGGQLPPQQQNTVVEVPSANKYQGGRSTVLEIRKIPKALNNIMKLSEHFQKFGTITKLQTPFDQDPQGALIEFSSNREAYAAYSSPEAILGNRFIKMFWYKPPKEEAAEKKSTINTTAAEEQQPPKKVATSHELKYRNPKSDPRLIQMEKKKELEKLEQLKLELKKKKQESYEDLVKKQKDISLKLQEKGLSKEEKTKLLKTFKACDAAVKKLEKELQEESKLKAHNPVKQFRDTKKEILDKEIDIYHGNLEGDELLEAKRDLELLKQESTFEYSRGRGHRGRGRGSWHRGRGRGRGSFNTTSVDNRPKKILVAGYDEADKDAVVAHFATFGQVSQIEEIDTTKMVLSFPTRRSAEMAAVQGTEFNGKQLSLSWFTGQTNKTSVAVAPQKIQRRITRSLSQSLMDKDLEDELEDLDKEEEEMLLAGVEDDEEEEEDSESGVERSWKR